MVNSRDLLSRVIFGSRLSLQVGLATITFANNHRGLLGAIAGYVGGWLDNVIMRIMDVMMAFQLVVAIAIVAVLGTGLFHARWPSGSYPFLAMRRLIRSTVLSVKELEYVEATRALGAGSLRILFTRVLPNAITPLIVQGTLGIATAILDAAALHPWVGAEPPRPEWGLMLGEERNSIFN